MVTTAPASPTPTPTLTPTETPVPPTATATSTPEAPEWTKDLPTGLAAVQNADKSWGVGVKNGNQIETISGLTADSSGIHLTLEDGKKVDASPDQLVYPEGKWFLDGQQQVVALNDPSGSWWQYEFDIQANKWVEKSLPEVSTNINNPAKIEWNDIVGNRWATAIRQAIDSGKIPTFGPDVVVSSMSLSNNYYDTYGYTFPDFSESHLIYITNPKSRPIMYAAYSEILINGSYHIILTEQIAQKVGFYGLVNIIDHVKGRLRINVEDPSVWVGPITKLKPNICAKYNNEAECLWSANIGNEIVAGAVDNWVNRGIVNDPILGKVLFMPGGARWY